MTGDAWEEQLESGRRATASGTRTSSPYQRRQALSDVFQHQSHINHPGCRAAMQQRLKASVCCLRHAAHVCGDITAEVLAALSIMSLRPHAAISHITGAVQLGMSGLLWLECHRAVPHLHREITAEVQRCCCSCR